MNTINFLDSIALIACITTPAYILFYLKYFVKETQSKQTENIITTQKEVKMLASSVESIQFDEKEKRIEHLNELSDINNLISRIEKQSELNKSDAESKLQNVCVQLDYVMKNIKNEKGELKQWINNLSNAQERFASNTYKDIESIKNEVNEFKNLNKKVENILKKINSKDFAMEVIWEYLVKAKEEKNANNPKESKTENKNNEPKKETKPTESLQNEVVNIIKEQPIIEQEFKKVRRQKSESKRVIGSRELEIYFKEQTTLTYRGYVLKHGQDAFKREKNLQYKKLYYKKFLKPNTVIQQIIEDNQSNK
jgi:hypothetical protein